jgi:prepilin-type processing-associated H-X9-DG protein
MATARFNVPCPVCEADVPTTSASVGKSITCPKCKKKFPCPPNPAGGPADEADAPAPKKAGKKGPPTLVIGAGLGALAIAVLIGGAVFVLDGDEPAKPVAQGGPRPTPPPVQPDPQPADPTTPPKDGTGDPMPPQPGDAPPDPKTPDPKPKETPKPPAPDRPPSGPRSAEAKKPPRTTPLPEVTNLLPGDAASVFLVNMAQAQKTPLYAAFFDETVRDLFHESFFFRSDLLSHVAFALSGPDREPFAVLRTDAPIDDRAMLDLMGDSLDRPKNSPIRDRYFYGLKNNPFLKAVGGTFDPASVLGQFGVRTPPAPKAADRPMAIHVYDDQTLILAAEGAMERFLSDLQPNGFPPFKTDLPPDPPKPPPPADPNAPPPAEGQPPAPPAAPAPPADPNAPVKRFTSVRNYQTIDPELKRLLNAYEPDTGAEPPAAVHAEFVDQRLMAARGYSALVGKDVPYAAGLAEQIRMFGFALTSYARDRLVGKVTVEFVSDDAAKTTAHQNILPALYLGTYYLGYGMTAPVYLMNEVSAPPPPAPNAPPPPPGQLPPTVWPLGLMPNGGGLPAPGDPAGGFPGFPPGGAPGFGPPGGFGGGRPGFGEGGEGAVGGFPQAPPPGTPGQPMTPTPNGAPAQPVVTVSAADRAVTVAVALTWPETWYNTTLAPLVTRAGAQFRGKMVVLSGTTNWDTLAGGVAKIGNRKLPFPRGALERDPTPERYRLAYPPEQRVSFLADLLPFIGRGGLRSQIQEKKFAWYAPENLPAAEAWIPEFLIPSYPPSSWRVSHPKAPGKFLGATNFVAPAGVGTDAARFNPADPDQARKVGITGYDWGSKAEQVTDGLSNTVYLIQGQPALPRAWIAGGGATVVGVDDTDAALTPFLAAGAGGRGAHVLMADGSVRFLKEGTAPKVFKSLVTRAGNDAVSDLDGVAPKVLPGRGELRGTVGGPTAQAGP